MKNIVDSILKGKTLDKPGIQGWQIGHGNVISRFDRSWSVGGWHALSFKVFSNNMITCILYIYILKYIYIHHDTHTCHIYKYVALIGIPVVDSLPWDVVNHGPCQDNTATPPAESTSPLGATVKAARFSGSTPPSVKEFDGDMTFVSKRKVCQFTKPWVLSVRLKNSAGASIFWELCTFYFAPFFLVVSWLKLQKLLQECPKRGLGAWHNERS